MKQICVSAVILAALFTAASQCDELDSDLAKSLLQERLYNTGLTTNGDSGFVLTSGTDTLYQGAWVVNMNGYLDRSGDNSPFYEFGVNLSASAGVWDDVFGIFSDMEVSLSVPYFFDEISSDSESGMGDPRISIKTKLLEGKILSDLPDISVILSAVLPGDEEGGYTALDQGGLEAGFIFGAEVPDSSGTSMFRLFLDVRYAVYDYLVSAEGDKEDQFITSHFGISFPILDLENCFFLLESGRTVKNAQYLNGTDYAVSFRYQSMSYNWTVGVVMKDFEEVYPSSRRLYLMYDHKF